MPIALSFLTLLFMWSCYRLHGPEGLVKGLMAIGIGLFVGGAGILTSTYLTIYQDSVVLEASR